MKTTAPRRPGNPTPPAPQPYGSRLIWLGLSLAVAGCAGPSTAKQDARTSTRVPEPIQPTWKSLAQYECPEWFRDAKFGIYAHWGVFSAANGSRNTDWYGRNMYKPGHPNY